MSRTTVLSRLRTWWSDLRCKGSVDYLTKSDAIAFNLLPASGLDVGLVDSDQLLIFKCSKWSEKCQRCSCVKTMRKLFPGSCDWDRYLNVFVGAKQSEANRDHSHGKAAEVDNTDMNMRDACRKPFGIAGGDHHLEPVHVPVAPSVEDAQDSTNQSDCQRARLENCRVHQNSSLGFAHYQRGHISHRLLNALLAALGAATLAAVLSASHLLDGPTDDQARTDTDQSTQDAQRNAQRTARFERAARKLCSANQGAFELLEDGAIQCLTRVGVPTLIAKVAL